MELKGGNKINDLGVAKGANSIKDAGAPHFSSCWKEGGGVGWGLSLLGQKSCVREYPSGTSVPIGGLGSPFSSKVVCGHCLGTLTLTINETLKWLSSLPILTLESFWR